VTAQQQLDPALEEAARVNGARSWRITTRITLPLLAPAVLSGATIIMYHTTRELAASLLLYAPGNQVMSVQIWDLYSNGNYVELFAFGLLNIALVLVLVGLANLAIGRKGWKR